LSEFTAAISIANENSGNLEGAGDVKMQSTTGNSMYALQDVPGKGINSEHQIHLFLFIHILSKIERFLTLGFYIMWEQVHW
jgi:hypothetical protein